MMMKWKQLLLGVFFSNALWAQVSVNVTSLGAKADGRFNNAAIIQKAIDKTSVKGGVVVIPKGVFVTGPLYLKSNVELLLQQGAVLLGSSKRTDYGEEEASGLINAFNQQNIAITGKGTIDGNAVALLKDILLQLQKTSAKDAQGAVLRPRESARPKLIDMLDCKNVTVKGITVKDGTGWIQDYKRCDMLTIDSVTVNSTTYWNNDGIDIVNCKNVSITHCNINASDDAIVLKSEAVEGFCENVFVSDCKLRSSANAFKLGTGSKGGFRNIVARNLEVYDTYRSAVALEAVDGGFLENIDVQNVRATNTGNAILIKLGHRNKDTAYSTVKNIHIANMYVEVPAGKPDKGYATEGPLLRYPPDIKPAPKGVFQSVSPWNLRPDDTVSIRYEHNVFPSIIAGLPGHPVENISLENIEIVYEGGASKNRAFMPLDSLEKITEAEAAYPEFSMLGELPCWGLYMRHAKGISMKNISLRYKTTDFRTAVVFDDVKGLSVNGLAVPTVNSSPVVFLNKVELASSPSLLLLEKGASVEQH